MEKGFDHLRCPMCDSELMYSEGTHDLCCRNNPYERMTRDHSVREEQASYGSEQSQNVQANEDATYIYKVWGKGWPMDDVPEKRPGGGGSREERGDSVRIRRVEGHGEDEEGFNPETKAGLGEGKQKACVFALTFTESGRYGTLWSIRTVHDMTNYFSLMSLMQKIEKRQKAGEQLAPNVPNLPKKTERSGASKLAFRYNIEVEDLYSIRYSSETPERLAGFYGLTVWDVRHIRKAEIEEGG